MIIIVCCIVNKIKEKYYDLSPVLRAMVWFTICNILTAGLSFISAPVFTRLLPEDEYGLLAIMITYEQLFVIFGTWEIQIGAYSKGYFNYKTELPSFTKCTILFVNLLTLLLFVIVLFLNREVSSITGISAISLGCLFLYLFFMPSYQAWLVRKRTEYDYRRAVSITLLYSVLNIAIPICALLLINKTANVKFSAQLLTASFFCFFFYIAAFKEKSNVLPRYHYKDYCRFLIAYQAPLVLHSLSYLALNQADRIMIGEMIGNKETAFYSVAYSLAMAITIIQSSINQAVGPWRYHKLEDKEYGQLEKNSYILLCALGLMIIAYVLIAPELMQVLFTDSYYESVWCIPSISAGSFFMFMYSIFVTVETYYEKTMYVMYVTLICGVINILLNYIFIGKYGYIASAYTTLFSYMLFALFHFIMMRKVCRVCIPGIKLFKPSYLILISLIFIVAVIIITILYQSILIRYMILLAVGACLFYKRDLIIKTIAMTRTNNS